MIVDERMVTYIHSLETPENSLLEEIEKEALDTYVPIIRKETKSFLKTLITMNRPMNILEVGTAVGFSALVMSEYAPAGCKITTIENYDKRIPIARENFKRAGKESDITLLEGDALEVMKGLAGPMTLYLWMRQRDSISIIFQRSQDFSRRAACWSLTMYFRTET